MIRISYDKLGRPDKPGNYMCPGVGEVSIDQDSLNVIAEYEGAAWLECEEISSLDSMKQTYFVMNIVPM